MRLTVELLHATLGTVAIWLAVLWGLVWRGSSPSYSQTDQQAIPHLNKRNGLGRLRRMKQVN